MKKRTVSKLSETSEVANKFVQFVPELELRIKDDVTTVRQTSSNYSSGRDRAGSRTRGFAAARPLGTLNSGTCHVGMTAEQLADYRLG